MIMELIKKTRFSVVLLTAIIIAAFSAGTEYAEAAVNAPGGDVITAEDLNAALGGIHKVEENKVILQDDVILEDNACVNMKQNEYVTLTLDTNGKSVEGKRLFDFECSGIRIKGGGSFRAEKNAFVLKNSYLAIDDGNFSVEKGAVVTTGNAYRESSSSIVIKGGTFTGTVIDTAEKELLYASIKGGHLGKIRMRDPRYIKNGSKSEYHMYNKWSSNPHVLLIKAGEIDEVNLNKVRFAMSGGTIGDGGIRGVSGKGADTEMHIRGGMVTGPINTDDRLVLEAGLITGDIRCGQFVMRGGIVRSSAGTAVVIKKKLKSSNISGGEIIAGAKSAVAVKIMKNARLIFDGGTIKGSSGRVGILLAGRPASAVKGKKIPELYFRCDEDCKLKISGFRYAVKGKKRKAKVKLSSWNRLKVKNGSKRKNYTGPRKLPVSIKGSIEKVIEF